MDKDILKGLKIGIGIFLSLSILFGIVFAVGFHTTSEILPGVFQGNYSFNGTLNFSNTVLEGLYPIMYVVDEKTSGTAGGTYTAGSWVNRTLNTIKINEIEGASLSSDIITLPEGTYYVEASAPGHRISNHRSRFYDINNSIYYNGTSEYTHNSYPVTTRSFVTAKFILNSESSFVLQHRGTSTYNPAGLGGATGLGPEIYSEVKIWKVK